MITLSQAVTLTKTLGHLGRLRIVSLLESGPLSVCQMAAALDMPLSTLSGHLLELRRADLVCEQRKSKWVYYHLNDVDTIAAVLAPVLAAITDDPIARRDAGRVAALQGKAMAAVCDGVTSKARLPRP